MLKLLTGKIEISEVSWLASTLLSLSELFFYSDMSLSILDSILDNFDIIRSIDIRDTIFILVCKSCDFNIIL